MRLVIILIKWAFYGIIATYGWRKIGKKVDQLTYQIYDISFAPGVNIGYEQRIKSSLPLVEAMILAQVANTLIVEKYYITAAVADDQDLLSIFAYAFCVDLGNIETDVRFVTVFCDYVVNSAGTITTFEARMGYDT